MARFCHARLRSSAIVGLIMAVYLVAFAAADPIGEAAAAPTYATSLGVQAASIAALGALMGVVTRHNAAMGCAGSRSTLTWITVGVLTANAVARLASLPFSADEAGKAKFVRWDAASRAVCLVVVLIELYYAMVPSARLRTTFFMLGLVFVVPAILALPRMFSRTWATTELLRAALAAIGKAYVQFDGKDIKDRIWFKDAGATLFVAFAGTETGGDVKADLNVGDIRIGWLPEEARAHAGFAGMYDKLRPHVHATIDLLASRRPEPWKRIVFTGHSLGGALATLAALDAAKNGVMRKGVGEPRRFAVRACTFGAPQVGDLNFVRAFDRLVPCARVVNPFDPVPKLLFSQLLHTKGYYAVASLTRDSPLTAHNLVTYDLALSRPRLLQTVGMLAPMGYVALAAVPAILLVRSFNKEA